MTNRYDWDAIRDRYESGESSGAISKSMYGSPTRQGIEKRAKREGWLKISKDAREAARNLPSIQNPKFMRAPSDELGDLSQKNAERILSAVERGAPPKLAAELVGLTLGQLKTWMSNDYQFAMEIKARVAQIIAEHVHGIRNADDWRAWKWFLEHDPSSREEYGPKQSKDEGAQIILNIHRDKVTVDGNVIESVAVEEREELLPELPKKEATETAVESQAEPLKSRSITDSPFPPRDPEGARERDRLEKERMERCWMGADWRERQVLDEHRAREKMDEIRVREERLKILGK